MLHHAAIHLDDGLPDCRVRGHEPGRRGADDAGAAQEGATQEGGLARLEQSETPQNVGQRDRWIVRDRTSGNEFQLLTES